MTKSDTIIELKKTENCRCHSRKYKGRRTTSPIACIKGGIKAIEIAYTNQYAGQIIKELVDLYQDDQSVCIGAGTVLDAVTARDAILAGANYVVSPSFHAETAKMCNLYSTPYIPGCITLTEITTALEAGSEIIKLFPGSTLSPAYISAVKAPIPQVSVMVTGGVGLNNIPQWFAAGADAVGIGGELNKLASQGNFDRISEIAQQYITLR